MFFMFDCEPIAAIGYNDARFFFKKLLNKVTLICKYFIVLDNRDSDVL